MRDTASSDGLTALAVAGTNVVMLGWDMPAAQIQATTSWASPSAASAPATSKCAG